MANKTLKEKLIEECIRDTAQIDKAYAKQNMNLVKGCRDFDYHLNELMKLEPEKKITELMGEIENYQMKMEKRK